MEKKEIINIMAKFVPRRTLFFDILVTEHCNLNCKGCGSFVPLAKPSYIDVIELEADLKRLSEISGGVCHHINLLGGEPLLHKDIVSIIRMTRKYFKNGIVNIVTNGILLDKMNENFWQVCKECDICICPTKYPIKVNYDALEEKARKEGVKYKLFGNVPLSGWIHKKMDLQGNRFENCSFMYCANANMCPVLKHGKLYPCPTVAHIEKFNQAFQTNLVTTNMDYIDIYEVEKLEEIMSFLARPVPFCRYCNTPAYEKDEWGISKKNIGEWT